MVSNIVLMPLLLLTAPTPPAPTLAGQVIVLHGHASLRDAAGGTQVLAVGATLHEGDRVKTGDQTSLRILLQDNSVLDLGPETDVLIKAFSVRDTLKPLVRLQTFLGQLWAHVRSRATEHDFFSVEGPNAVAGVRGTSFVMNVTSNNTTSITTVTGSVGVQDSFGHQTTVGPFERASTQGNGFSTSHVTPAEIGQLRTALAPPAMLGHEGTQARLEFATQQMQNNPANNHPDNGRDNGSSPTSPTNQTAQPLNIDPSTRLTHVQGQVVLNL